MQDFLKWSRQLIYIKFYKLHLFEKMQVVTAHDERFRSLSEFYNSPACKEPTDIFNPGYVYDSSPMNLPELLRIEFMGQFFDTLFN